MKHWYAVLLLPILASTIRSSYAKDSPLLSPIVFGGQPPATTPKPAQTPLFANDTIPGDEEISETGVVKQVDDAGYPIAILTIEFPKQQTTERFTINLDDVTTVQIATLTGLVGKQISFRYASESVNALLEIEVGGRFLLDADTSALTSMTSRVTGKLGADEITTGDVPGLITVTASDGELTEFPFFITSELLEVNGTTVTAFYEERTARIIKSMTIIK